IMIMEVEHLLHKIVVSFEICAINSIVSINSLAKILVQGRSLLDAPASNLQGKCIPIIPCPFVQKNLSLSMLPLLEA
ncbi:hypothetical protein PSY47_23570, partial [Shigella flexneri]|nr:hypothetical protein [Shigella flexneri]